MITVKSILQAKGHDVVSVSPDATVFEALKIMADHNVGALIVLDGKRVAGLMSERDYARKVVLLGKSSRELKVQDIMATRVYFMRPEQSVQDCMAQMTDKRVRHLPVLDGDDLIGVVSIGDVVKSIIADQESTIKLLENYITGGV